MSEEEAGAVVVTLGPFAESKITGSDSQAELTTAMVAVQAEIVDPPKDQHNPAVKADLRQPAVGLAWVPAAAGRARRVDHAGPVHRLEGRPGGRYHAVAARIG